MEEELHRKKMKLIEIQINREEIKSIQDAEYHQARMKMLEKQTASIISPVSVVFEN